MGKLSGRRLTAFAVLAALVVAAHFLPGFSTSDLLAELRNGVHIVGFALIAGFLYTEIRTSIPVRVCLVLLIIALLGVVSEFVQSGFGSVDLYDVSRDLAGASIFLVAMLLWSWSARVRRGALIIRCLSAVVALAVFAPLVYWSMIFAGYARQFPVILDFDGRADQMIFKPIDAGVTFVDAPVAGDGFTGQALQVELLHDGWSGIRLGLPIIDWSDYRFLTFRISMRGDTPRDVEVRLHDGVHPGFSTLHLIGSDRIGAIPEAVRFALRDLAVIPGRPDVDPSRVYEIYIIGTDNPPGTTMYLDDIRLE